MTRVVRTPRAGRPGCRPTIEVTEELLWLLGLWVAEGCSHGQPTTRSSRISGDDERARRGRPRSFERDLGLHVVCAGGGRPPGASIFVHSRLLLASWDHLGFDDNRKRIPGWILGLPLERLKWFIEGYREGDGVHSGKKFDEGVRHEFSTVSEELKDDLDRRPRPLRHLSVRRPVRDDVPATDGRSPVPVLAAHRCRTCSRGARSTGTAVSTQRLNAGRYRRPRLGAGRRRSRRSAPTALVYDFSVPGSGELLGRYRRDGAQHLRAADAAGRRAGGVELPRPGAAGQADHGVRRRQPDPLVLLRRRRGARVPRPARLRHHRPGQHRQPRRVHDPSSWPSS